MTETQKENLKRLLDELEADIAAVKADVYHLSESIGEQADKLKRVQTILRDRPPEIRFRQFRHLDIGQKFVSDGKLYQKVDERWADKLKNPHDPHFQEYIRFEFRTVVEVMEGQE